MPLESHSSIPLAKGRVALWWYNINSERILIVTNILGGLYDGR